MAESSISIITSGFAQFCENLMYIARRKQKQADVNRPKPASSLAKLEKLSKHYLEIYLYCPKVSSRRVRRGDYQHFFTNIMNNIEKVVDGQPIFLDEYHALQYSRLMGHDNAVVKAFVSDVAIESHCDELKIKRGYLNHKLIHGVFPSWDNTQEYIPNPLFELSV